MKQAMQSLARSILAIVVSAPSYGWADGVAMPRDLVQNFWIRSQGDSEFPATIMRMDVDIDGDGRKDLLLANSQNSGTSGIDEWFVYTTVGEQQYRFVGSLGLYFRSFRVESAPARLLALHPSGRLVSYSVTATALVEEQVAEGVDTGAESAKFEKWRKEVNLQVLAANSRDVGQGNPRWTDLLTSEVVSGVGDLGGLSVVE